MQLLVDHHYGSIVRLFVYNGQTYVSDPAQPQYVYMLVGNSARQSATAPEPPNLTRFAFTSAFTKSYPLRCIGGLHPDLTHCRAFTVSGNRMREDCALGLCEDVRR